MTFNTHAEIARGRIDPVPMVDVVFLLMIFFVLSSSFVLTPGYRVVLPGSSQYVPNPPRGLVVTVTQENLLFFNDQRTTLERLRVSLQAAGQHGSGQELIIKADQQVPHHIIVDIMNMAVEAKITAITIATRPEVSATQAAGAAK